MRLGSRKIGATFILDGFNTVNFSGYKINNTVLVIEYNKVNTKMASYLLVF